VADSAADYETHMLTEHPHISRPLTVRRAPFSLPLPTPPGHTAEMARQMQQMPIIPLKVEAGTTLHAMMHGEPLVSLHPSVQTLLESGMRGNPRLARMAAMEAMAIAQALIASLPMEKDGPYA
jgi:hypothetical protein